MKNATGEDDRKGAGWRVARRELIPHPPKRVWTALTNPDELTAWFCERADVDLRKRGRLAFFGETVYSAIGDEESASGAESLARPGNFEILDLEEPEYLEFRWWLGNTETLVRIELNTHLMQTDLTISQSAQTSPAWPTDPDVPNWWWVSLPALRSYLDHGTPRLRLNYETLRRAATIRFQIPVSTFPWVIWSKLTLPEELVRWWAQDPEVDLRAGGTFRLQKASGTGPRKILEYTPARKLVHDWHWEGGTVGRIEWDIEETDNDTLLSVTDHGPWDPSAERDRLGLLWASSLLHLEHLSARGITPREHIIG